MFALRYLGLLAVALGCSAGCGDAESEPLAPVCDRPLTYEKSPGPALQGSGWHRLYIQGGEATPKPDGRFGMTEHRTEVANGDHFLLSQGALAEWTYPLVDPPTGHVYFHIARVDDPDVVARYELELVRGDTVVPLIAIDDTDTGEMGYVPFEQCLYGGGADSPPEPEDYLRLRVTNLSGGMLGVVTQAPDYYTWLDLEVR